MILDMSQAAVNRTAMYTVSHDVLRILSDVRPSCQYFGRVFSRTPNARMLRDYQNEGFSRIFSGKFGRPADISEHMTGRTVYLDPLYCLLGDLSCDDVVTVLDLTPVTRPDWHAPDVARAYAAAFDLVSSRRPHVIAISQNTADTLYANYGFPRERIQVVPLYVPGHFADPADVRPFHAPWPYVLFVGSLELRKNLIGAVKSFERSGLAERGYRLLIIGGRGHGADEIETYAARAPNVIFSGYVSNSELKSIYAGARAFIYPSYLEGFGIPLLEALNFGVPSVASLTGACPEVGGDLVPYIDPDDHAGFATELARLVDLTVAQRAEFAAKARMWIGTTFSVRRFETDFRRALGLSPETVGAAPAAAVP